MEKSEGRLWTIPGLGRTHANACWHTLSPMSQVFLLLPDFLLIVLGWLLCRHTLLDRSVWDSVEKLVYHLLFPVLLFVAILRQPLQPGALMTLAGCGLTVVAVGIALAGKLDKKNYTTFCIMGDGEQQEGAAQGCDDRHFNRAGVAVSRVQHHTASNGVSRVIVA